MMCHSWDICTHLKKSPSEIAGGFGTILEGVAGTTLGTVSGFTKAATNPSTRSKRPERLRCDLPFLFAQPWSTLSGV